MERTYYTLSLGHWDALALWGQWPNLLILFVWRVYVMRCFGLVRTIPTSSSSTDETFSRFVRDGGLQQLPCAIEKFNVPPDPHGSTSPSWTHASWRAATAARAMFHVSWSRVRHVSLLVWSPGKRQRVPLLHVLWHRPVLELLVLFALVPSYSLLTTPPLFLVSTPHSPSPYVVKSY